MLKAQFGFSALEAVIAVAISSMTLMGMGQLIVNTQKTELRSVKLFWLSARRTQFQNIIRTPTGWQSILTKNPDMSCLNLPAGCGSFTSPQNLKLPVDSVDLDGADPLTGLSGQGDFCTSFDPVAGNSSCPIGISLKWQIICDDAMCLHGQPKITIQFQHKDGEGHTEELSSYNIIAYHDPKMETLSEVCASMGGTLAGMTCNLVQLSTACNPTSGSFVLGFDNLGTVICGRPNPGSCSAADAAVGFNSSGGIQCAPACP